MRDRRQHERVSLGIDVWVQPEGYEPFPAEVINLSMGGLFAKGECTPEAGAFCRVEILLCERGDPLNVWLEGWIARSGERGFAVRVTGIFQDSLDRLRELMTVSGRLAA